MYVIIIMYVYVKYSSLSIPLVHNSWAARSVSQVSIQLHFLLGEKSTILYAKFCYTFLNVKTRQV